MSLLTPQRLWSAPSSWNRLKAHKVMAALKLCLEFRHSAKLLKMPIKGTNPAGSMLLRNTTEVYFSSESMEEGVRVVLSGPDPQWSYLGGSMA